jgi:sulfur relay (sulfurtransferase) DsrF/TusC family protein
LDKTTTWLFIIGSSPYTHGLPSDPAVDMTMAAGAFGQTASVLFIGDGCQYLNQGVLPPADQADLRKLLKSLPFYDVDQLFVGSTEPIANIDLDELPVTYLQPSDITSLVSSAAHVVTFT